MKRRMLLPIFLLASSPCLAELPDFKGYYIANDQARCLFQNPATLESSGWVTIGDRFMGYELIELNTNVHSMLVERDGKTFDLPLDYRIFRVFPLLKEGCEPMRFPDPSIGRRNSTMAVSNA